MPLYMAPMQGLTDFIFRREWQKYFTGIDKFFTPFIFFDKSKKLANKHWREINPQHNNLENTVAQILTNSPEEAQELCSYIEELGYKELNLNMGCPFPMITNKKCGSGILPHPEVIENVLTKISESIHINFSIKLRLGLSSSEEINSIIPILNNTNCSEVILHPRIGKQQYSGSVDLESYILCAEEISHPVVYNGDITTNIGLSKILDTIPKPAAIMIGRGIVANPFLAEDIKTQQHNFQIDRFSKFHESLIISYSEYLEGGDKQVIMKMNEKWEYFSTLFPNNKKEIKKLRKANKLNNYRQISNQIFSSYDKI